MPATVYLSSEHFMPVFPIPKKPLSVVKKLRAEPPSNQYLSYHHLCLRSSTLLALLHLNLQEQRTVDVGQDTTESDGCLDQMVQLLITADSELQVTWCDALNLQVLGGVACKLKDFRGEVLEDGSEVDGSLCADAGLLTGDGSKVTLYATAWELKPCLRGVRLGHLVRLSADLATCLAAGLAFASRHCRGCV